MRHSGAGADLGQGVRRARDRAVVQAMPGLSDLVAELMTERDRPIDHRVIPPGWPAGVPHFYPNKIPACVERLRLPQSALEATRHGTCVECGRVTVRMWKDTTPDGRWTTETFGDVVPWCAGELPAGLTPTAVEVPVKPISRADAVPLLAEWNRGNYIKVGVEPPPIGTWLLEPQCPKCRPDRYCRRHDKWSV